MLAELIFAALLGAICIPVFWRYEEHTPSWKRASKWGFYFLTVALVAHFAGRPWSFVYVVVPFALGLGFHTWWCRTNGIHFLRAEPRDRYYRLRGWPVERLDKEASD